ncbi:hypothetical protein C2869_18870 [Saccharobesus litoralis]|uniref:Uncharacterized protein n=1 Tax=Saccharobesus litoralis TaxID=2172099 RepID=A0A2S0VVU3_9ALTE|nr:hypothetical protein [Saccharobesus litoralis]AWB68344.1 hypothetical protein C2869_18870 [Saccharobesus litoralis]
MTLWSMITVVSVVAIVSGAYMSYLQSKKADVDNDLKSEIEDMKQRISTLESIVTDKKYDLKREIDSL